MKPIRIGSALRIEIGYDGENGARQIVFDATKWMDELPGCTAAITAVRADGEPYIAPNVTQDEEKKTITWTLTSAETMEGEGRAQLLWMDGERIAKQAIFTTVCHASLQNDATEIDVPEPVWAQQSLAAAKAAKASAEAAAASEEGAKAALEETKGVRDNAKKEIDEKKERAIDGINNAKAEAIASIEAEKDELAPPIICTKSGTVITITDSADRQLRGMTVFGRTEQDGVPSEDAPAAIDSVGSKGSVELTVARGLPDTIVIIKQPRHLAGAVGDTVIFEVIALGYGLTYQWQWKGSSAWDNTGLEGNKTASLIVPVTQSRNGNRYRCVIKDANGHTVTTKDASLTVGDVAESDDAADDTQTATISTAEGLRGVPVMSGTGTYTDTDGQGWIADTIEYDAQAGTAKIVRRVGMVMYDGSVDEEWAKSSEKGLFSILINGCSQTSHGICTHYEVGDIVADQGAYGFSAGAWPGLIVVRPADYADLTVDAWRARLNASPVTVLYALAVPEETPITGDELTALAQLRSRYPETTIYNDDAAQMAARYIADTKKYVDDADAEIAKAVIGVDERVDAAMENIADAGKRADAAQTKADENERNIGQIKDDIDAITIPTALPNPHALTINGTSYDGSEAVTIDVTGDGGSVEVDDTLSKAGASADAKATGDAIGQLKNDLTDINSKIQPVLNTNIWKLKLEKNRGLYNGVPGDMPNSSLSQIIHVQRGIELFLDIPYSGFECVCAFYMDGIYVKNTHILTSSRSRVETKYMDNEYDVRIQVKTSDDVDVCLIQRKYTGESDSDNIIREDFVLKTADNTANQMVKRDAVPVYDGCVVNKSNGCTSTRNLNSSLFDSYTIKFNGAMSFAFDESVTNFNIIGLLSDKPVNDFPLPTGYKLDNGYYGARTLGGTLYRFGNTVKISDLMYFSYGIVPIGTSINNVFFVNALGTDFVFTAYAIMAFMCEDTDIGSVKQMLVDILNRKKRLGGIACFGDSLTSIGGWEDVLHAKTMLPVFNFGQGGEASQGIASRQGGQSIMIDKLTIPADTSEVVIAMRKDGLKTIDGKRAVLLTLPASNTGDSGINPCSIGGVEGYFELIAPDGNGNSETAYWMFRRNESGNEVIIDRPTELVTNAMIHFNDAMLVIFMGANDGTSELEGIVNLHRRMIDFNRNPGRKYICVGRHLGIDTDESGNLYAGTLTEQYERAMMEAFGRKFVSLRQYITTPVYDGENIVSCYGMQDAGLVCTASDIDAIQRGTCPPSLMTDAIHFTKAMRNVVGEYLYKRMNALGYFD